MSNNKSILVVIVFVVIAVLLVVIPIISTAAEKVNAAGDAIGNKAIKIITDYDYGKSVSAEKLASVSQADIDTWCQLYVPQGAMADKCK